MCASALVKPCLQGPQNGTTMIIDYCLCVLLYNCDFILLWSTPLDNSDYMAITNQIVGPFSDSRRQKCFLVEITNDTIPENSENFFLDLASPPGEMLEHVTISPSQATVTIEDDDRELSSDTATPHSSTVHASSVTLTTPENSA